VKVVKFVDQATRGAQPSPLDTRAESQSVCDDNGNGKWNVRATKSWVKSRKESDVSRRVRTEDVLERR
jgi:hypothetical protein